MTIGEKIKQRRKELGIGQTEIAKRLKLNRRSIYRIEKENLNMRYTTQMAICKELGLNPETLEPNELPKRSAWDDLNEFEIIEADYYGEEGDGYYPVYEKATIDAFKRKYESELKQMRAKD